MVKCMKVAEESSTETVLKLSLTCGAGVPKVRAEDVLASGISLVAPTTMPLSLLTDIIRYEFIERNFHH